MSEEKIKYIPVVEKADAQHYVSDGDMINFITTNSGMDWNVCCDYVRDKNITGEEGVAFWDKDILKNPQEYNEGAILFSVEIKSSFKKVSLLSYLYPISYLSDFSAFKSLE